LNISSTAIINQADIKNIWFTPALPDVICSLNGIVNVSGLINCNSNVHLIGTIVTHQLIYSPLNKLYQLIIHAHIIGDHVMITGGIATSLVRSELSRLELDNGVVYTVGTYGKFGNVTGKGQWLLLDL